MVTARRTMLLWLSLLYTTNIRFSVQSLPLFVSPATIIIPTIRTSTTKQTAVAAAAAASRLQQRILQQQRQRYVVSTTYDGFGLSPFVTTTVTSLSLSSAGNGDYSSSSYVEDGTSTIHDDDDDDRREVLRVRNTSYVKGLIQNLENVLDQYILTNENSYNEQAYNIFELIKQHTVDDDVILQAIGMIQHAGLSESNANNKSNTSENRNEGSAAKNSNEKLLGKTDEVERKKKAETRKQWEEFRSKQASNVAAGGRSALSRRQMNDSNRPDGLFLNNFALNTKTQSDQLLSDKQYLERIAGTSNSTNPKMENFVDGDSNNNDIAIKASTIVSEYVAKAGGISNFDGQSLGIGGLDDVLGQIKRRVWIPLAAPPILLHELGIQPVRGLLLYGKSGNGKTLLARTIGRLLSPLRPITIVSGPEIMDKFVGSSEQKLREIFDNPPDIYENFKAMEYGEALGRQALHVVIMDEFDAIARARGGRGGAGDQGDAGVARDSVVNQLLAKMDGVAPLVVPTLVIGLTNRRSLVDKALLRPGRFEVQIEVPPPKTVEQRISILNVHIRHMHTSGRLLVRDAPFGSAAAALAHDGLPSYAELLTIMATKCVDFSGASLAGVARAAASHALERSVEEFAQGSHSEGSLLTSCVVTSDDFESAVQDILDGLGDADWTEDDDSSKAQSKDSEGKSSEAAGEPNSATGHEST